MSSVLRKARPEDLDLVVSLMSDFYAESGHRLDAGPARRALEELIEGPALGRVWLIHRDHDVAGYVAITLGFSLEFFGRDAHIADLFIEPTFRGQGLGARALAAVEDECRSLGALALHVEVGGTNDAAQALYRAQGLGAGDRQFLTKRIVAADDG